MGLSGADLEYSNLLERAGILPANAQGYDAARLEQLADEVYNPVLSEVIAVEVEAQIESNTPGSILGSGTRSSQFQNTVVGAASALSLIPGLVTVPITGQGRPVTVKFYCQGVLHSVANTTLVAYTEVNGSVVSEFCNSRLVRSFSTTEGTGFHLEYETPNLVQDTLYTFKAGIFSLSQAGTITVQAANPFAKAGLTVISR